VNGYRGPAGISAGAAHTAVRAGGLVIDLREPADFAAGHPRGAINLPPGPGIGARAAGVLPHDPRVVLLATDRLQATETARQLLRVGVSRIDGFIGGGFAVWRAAGLPTSERPSVLSV
jgi:rhodanese-related sulfurtransferase